MRVIVDVEVNILEHGPPDMHSKLFPYLDTYPEAPLKTTVKPTKIGRKPGNFFILLQIL